MSLEYNIADTVSEEGKSPLSWRRDEAESRGLEHIEGDRK